MCQYKDESDQDSRFFSMFRFFQGWVDPEQQRQQWKGEGIGMKHRTMLVSITSNEHVVPSSTTKEAEKQRERNLAKTADEGT